MKEPVWVLDEVVPAIHSRQLAEHGGDNGTRDEGLLASALARPRQIFAYEEDTVSIARLAAAYASGIIRNHPFIDGNKRTGFVVALVFLRLNGWDLEATQEEKYRVFYALAAGEFKESDLERWIEQRLTKFE
jgi:death-on-curing protein